MGYRTRKSQGGRQRGSSLVEFMVTAPVLLLLFSGMLDLGRAFYYQVSAVDAARDSVRVLIGNYSGTGPGYSAVCAEAQSDLTNVASVSCVQASTAPPYAPGTYTPSRNQALVVIYCAPSGCGGSGGSPQHATVGVTIYYGFTTITPAITQMASGGMITMSDVARGVTNW